MGCSSPYKGTLQHNRHQKMKLDANKAKLLTEKALEEKQEKINEERDRKTELLQSLKGIRKEALEAAIEGRQGIQVNVNNAICEFNLEARGFKSEWKQATKPFEPPYQRYIFKKTGLSMVDQYKTSMAGVRSIIQNYKNDPTCNHPLIEKIIFLIDDFDINWRVGSIPESVYLRFSKDYCNLCENTYLQAFTTNNYLVDFEIKKIDFKRFGGFKYEVQHVLRVIPPLITELKSRVS